MGTRLGELCTMYWRLLEKRNATAFVRTEGKTTGGSNGANEAKGMKLLQAIDVRMQDLEPINWHEMFREQEPVAMILKEKMIDIVVGEFTHDQIYYLCHRAATSAALKMQIYTSSWVNQVAAYTFKAFTGKGIGPRPAGANPFV